MFSDERWALACAIVLFTTPVVLNASLFNEHAPATGLLLFAIARMSLPAPSAPWLVASGVAIGLAVTMRLELAATVPALAAFTALVSESWRECMRRLNWVAIGGSLPVAGYVAVNYATLGMASPMLHPDYASAQADRYRDAIEPDFAALTGVPSSVLYIPLVLGMLAFRHRSLELVRRLAMSPRSGSGSTW